MEDTTRAVPWDTVAAVRAGDSRSVVFESIGEKPRYAAEIASGESFSRDVASKQVRWLKGEGLIECLTPSRPHCRIYGLTDEGREVYEHL